MFAAIALTALTARPIEPNFLRDSMLGAVAESEKTFDKQFHLASHCYFGGLVGPGKSIDLTRGFPAEAAVAAFSGESKKSKLTLKIVDETSKKTVDTYPENVRGGSIYWNPEKGHNYRIIVTNKGDQFDYASVVMTEGGSSPVYHVSKLKAVANDFGAKIGELVAAGTLGLAENRRSVNLSLLKSKGTTFFGPMGIKGQESVVYAGGDANVASVVMSLQTKDGDPVERSEMGKGLRQFHIEANKDYDVALHFSNTAAKPVIVGYAIGTQS